LAIKNRDYDGAAPGLDLTVSAAVMGAALDIAFARNIAEMKALLKQFGKEFPPCVGFTGYVLVGVICGRKDKFGEKCRLCPHSLAWRKFDYTKRRGDNGKPAFLWTHDPRMSSLPSAFLRRGTQSAVKWRYYNERVLQLNEQRKKLSAFRRSFQAAYKSIKISRTFKDTGNSLEAETF
jgi:hypothetical protein